jgi:hypothetical protein
MIGMAIKLERRAIIFARPFPGEQPSEIFSIINNRLAADGFESGSRPVLRPFKKNRLPLRAVIATDTLARFINTSVADVVQLLFLLVERGCEVRLYKGAKEKCQIIDHDWIEALRLLGDELPRAHRSQKIKSGQFAAVFERNMLLGRKPILTKSIEDAILAASSEQRSLRKIELLLRSQGHSISRATIQRFLAAHRRRKV